MPIVPAARSRRKGNLPAEDLHWQLEKGLSTYFQREWKFHETRKWRFDLALPAMKLAIEIEGGLFLKDSGRHNRGAGMRADLEKYNEALILGWRVLRVLPEWCTNGKAFGLVERALRVSGAR